MAKLGTVVDIEPVVPKRIPSGLAVARVPVLTNPELVPPERVLTPKSSVPATVKLLAGAVPVPKVSPPVVSLTTVPLLTVYDVLLELAPE